MTTETREASLLLDTGGLSQAVSISSTSAQSAAITGKWAVIHATVACFMRRGTDPTALSDGTDQYLPASVSYRVAINSGDKIAFKTASASGTVYITPEA